MATTAVYGSNRCAAVFSPTSRAASTWHASQWSGACQLRWPASRNTLHAHRHRYTPGRCAATCLTSQPQQARQAQQHSIRRLWHNTRRTPPHHRCHRHTPPHTLPPRGHTTLSAATRSLQSLHAATRSLPSLHALCPSHCHRHTPPATWPSVAPCTITAVALRRHTLAVIAIHHHMAASCVMLQSQPSLHAATRAAIATRGRSLAASGATLHTHGRRRHATYSRPSLHAATLAAIATCRRHAPRRSAAQHGPYVACSLYGLS